MSTDSFEVDTYLLILSGKKKRRESQEEQRAMKTGVYYDQPIEDYHDSNGISKTGLCMIARAPALYEHCYLKGERISKDSPSKQKGKLFHAMMDGSFEEEYAVGPKVRRNTKEWKDFLAANPDKVCVKESDVLESRKMVTQLKKFGTTEELILEDGDYEVSYYWIDPSTGLLCKCRPVISAQIFRPSWTLRPQDQPKERIFYGFLQL